MSTTSGIADTSGANRNSGAAQTNSQVPANQLGTGLPPANNAAGTVMIGAPAEPSGDSNDVFMTGVDEAKENLQDLEGATVIKDEPHEPDQNWAVWRNPRGGRPAVRRYAEPPRKKRKFDNIDEMIQKQERESRVFASRRNIPVGSEELRSRASEGDGLVEIWPKRVIYQPSLYKPNKLGYVDDLDRVNWISIHPSKRRANAYVAQVAADVASSHHLAATLAKLIVKHNARVVNLDIELDPLARNPLSNELSTRTTPPPRPEVHVLETRKPTRGEQKRARWAAREAEVAQAEPYTPAQTAAPLAATTSVGTAPTLVGVSAPLRPTAPTRTGGSSRATQPRAPSGQTAPLSSTTGLPATAGPESTDEWVGVQTKVRSPAMETQDPLPGCCANCKKHGHALDTCSSPSWTFGNIPGCPFCNTTEHDIDNCPKIDGTDWSLAENQAQLLDYLYTKRVNKPQIRSRKFNFVDLLCSTVGPHNANDDLSNAMPWSDEFSMKMSHPRNSGVDLENKLTPETYHNRQLTDASYLPSDPRWKGITRRDLVKQYIQHGLDDLRFLPLAEGKVLLSKAEESARARVMAALECERALRRDKTIVMPQDNTEQSIAFYTHPTDKPQQSGIDPEQKLWQLSKPRPVSRSVFCEDLRVSPDGAIPVKLVYNPDRRPSDLRWPDLSETIGAGIRRLRREKFDFKPVNVVAKIFADLVKERREADAAAAAASAVASASDDRTED